VLEHRHILDRVARKLIEDETLEGDDVLRLFSDDDIDSAQAAATPPPASPSRGEEPKDERPELPKPRTNPGLAWGGTATAKLLPPERPLS